MHGNHPQFRESSPREISSLSTQQVSPLNTTPPLATEAAGQTSRQERPETHQNLIHPDKDHKPSGQLPPPGRNKSRSRTTVQPAEPVFHPSTAFRKPSHALVETIGFEPTTPCLQSRCSPS